MVAAEQGKDLKPCWLEDGRDLTVALRSFSGLLVQSQQESEDLTVRLQEPSVLTIVRMSSEIISLLSPQTRTQ